MPQIKGGKKPLAALIASACAMAAPVVMKWEGYRPATYKDPIGILTQCWGHTGPEVKMGQRRTEQECRDILQKDLKQHAEGVAACVPQITEKTPIFASSVSLSVNIGVRRFCQSTAARRFRAGDFRGGCEAQSWFQYAGGRKLAGLTKRRTDERENLCFKGL